MKAVHIAVKDVREILADKKSLFFIVLLPVFFTVFMGLVLNAAYEGEEEIIIPIGVANADGDSFLSKLLIDKVDESGVLDVELVGPEAADDAERRVARRDLAAVLRIPTGYSNRASGQSDAQPVIVVDRTNEAGDAARSVLETAVGRVAQAVRIAEIVLGRRYSGSDDAQFQLIVEDAVDRWEDPPLRMDVRPTMTETDATAPSMSGFIQASSGMMIQFSIMGLITGAMVLLVERNAGALSRLLTTPVRRSSVIAGHTAAMFVLVLTQQIVLILVGQLGLGVDYFSAPLATLLVAVSLSAWAAALGLFISTICKSEDQVVVVSLVAMFAFSGLGGAWFPLDIAGKTFAAIGHALPTAWAIDGYQNVSLRGLGVRSVLLPSAVVAAYGLFFYVLAVFRFRYDTSR